MTVRVKPYVTRQGLKHFGPKLKQKKIIKMFILLPSLALLMLPLVFVLGAVFPHSTTTNVVNPVIPAHPFAWSPLIHPTFLLIAGLNLLGMIPGVITGTAQIVITLCLALTLLLPTLYHRYGFHGGHALSLVHVPGLGVALGSLLAAIETISLGSRLIALAVRLFCNLMAGHVLLKSMLGGIPLVMMLVFAGGSGAIWGVVGWISVIALIVAVTGLEIVVALVQAYVFVVLVVTAGHGGSTDAGRNALLAGVTPGGTESSDAGHAVCGGVAGEHGDASGATGDGGTESCVAGNTAGFVVTGCAGGGVGTDLFVSSWGAGYPVANMEGPCLVAGGFGGLGTNGGGVSRLAASRGMDGARNYTDGYGPWAVAGCIP